MCGVFFFFPFNFLRSYHDKLALPIHITPKLPVTYFSHVLTRKNVIVAKLLLYKNKTLWHVVILIIIKL